MKKLCKDPVREDRIHEEAIVDAYGPEEKAMSWYYKTTARPVSPTRRPRNSSAAISRTKIAPMYT